MKNLISVFSFFMAVLLASPAFAAGGKGMGLSFLWVVINFAILVVGFYFLLRKQAVEFFQSRSLNTKKAVDEAKRFYEESHRKFEEIECRLKNSDVEGKKLIEEIKTQAENEKQRIVTEARNMATKLNADAKKLADQELLRAKNQLQAEAVELAAELAAQKIKASLTDSDQTRLGNDFIQTVQKGEVA